MLPALAPAWDENICPHWAERWEVRTRPLGCQVSTITMLGVLVGVAATIGGPLIAWALILTWRWLRAVWFGLGGPERWRDATAFVLGGQMGRDGANKTSGSVSVVERDQEYREGCGLGDQPPRGGEREPLLPR